MVGSTLGIIFLMGLVIIAIEQRQTKTLLSQTEKRGIAVTKSIAAASTNFLLSYNYIALHQIAEKAVQEEDIHHVIILDKEHNVAAYSEHPEHQGKMLHNPTNQRALESQIPLVQMTHVADRRGKKLKVMDVAIPVYLEEATTKWGTVRVGLSLNSMYQELFRTRLILIGIGFIAVFLGLGGATILASKITKPIESLVTATTQAAQGDLHQRITIETHDELGTLGASFNRMIENLGKKTKELIEIKNHLDRVIECSPDAITVIDTQGKIVTFNEAAEKLTGYKTDEVVGLPIAKFYPNSHEAEKITALLKDKGKISNHETTIMDKEKRHIPISLSVSLLRGEDGQPLGSVGISRDLREMKHLQQRLFQSEKLAATAKLAASIAHEVSNPIYGIQNCIDLLTEDFPEKNPKHRYLNLARKEIKRVATLVRQMIDFHRPIDEPFRSIDINMLLSEILVLDGKRLQKSNIRISQNLHPNLPKIQGAENQLKQVFYNVIINAREAMPEGGNLRIATSQENQRVRIDISDNGTGIEPEDLEHIFEPFYTTKPEVKGVGLGLSVSYGIIQKHGGTIDVQSAVGHGTVFTIRFPVESEIENDTVSL